MRFRTRKVAIWVAIITGTLCLLGVLAYSHYSSKIRTSTCDRAMRSFEVWLDEYKRAEGGNPEWLVDACKPNCAGEIRMRRDGLGYNYGCPISYGPFFYYRGEGRAGDWSFVANWGPNGRWDVPADGNTPRYQSERQQPVGDDLLLRDSPKGWRLVSDLPGRRGGIVSLRDIDRLEIGMTQSKVAGLIGEPYRKDASCWSYRLTPYYSRESYKVEFGSSGTVTAHGRGGRLR